MSAFSSLHLDPCKIVFMTRRREKSMELSDVSCKRDFYYIFFVKRPTTQTIHKHKKLFSSTFWDVGWCSRLRQIFLRYFRWDFFLIFYIFSTKFLLSSSATPFWELLNFFFISKMFFLMWISSRYNKIVYMRSREDFREADDDYRNIFLSLSL